MEPMELDITIFRVINSLAGQSGFWDGFWIFATDYLPYLMIVAAFVILIIWRGDIKEKIKTTALFAAGSTFSYLLAIAFFNNIWHRLRPFEALQGVTQLVVESGFSFPSKHAMLVFLLSTYVYRFNKRLGVVFYILSSLVAVSRVVTGVHYPSDVLAGIVIGIIIGKVIASRYHKTSTTA